MDNPNPIYYRDLITPDNSITDLISQLDELIKEYENAKSKIQGAAADIAKGMQGVSGASEEQRKSIVLSTEASQKLLAEYNKIDDELLNAKKAQAELNAVNREYNQIAKLLTEVNAAKEGSYKQLSAQYRLNKIALNEMSKAERENTEFGRKLEAETKAIYERMNELQKATGKAQLQVGQYERALGGLVGVNGRFLNVLTDSNTAVNTFKGVLRALATPLGAIIGAVGAVTAAFKLFQSSVHSTQQSGDALDADMAGWSATWELFKKSVASVDFGLFIRGAADAARAGRELKMVLDETFERTNSARLLRASLSQENAALQEAMRNQNLTTEERIAAANKYLENMSSIYAQETETARRNRDAQLDYLFTITNTREFASEEERKRAQEEFATNIKNYNLNEDLIKQAQAYNQAVERRATLYDNVSSADANVYRNLERTAAALDAQIAGTSDAVKQFAQFAKQYSLTSDEQVKAYVDAQVAYDEATAAVYNDQRRIYTMRDSLVAQQAAKERSAAAAAKKQREQDAKDAEKAAKDQAKAEAQAAKDAEDARKKEIADQRAYLQFQLQTIQLQISATKDGTNEMLALRIAAIEKQRELELFENKNRVEKLRQDEKDINAKFDAQALKFRSDFYVKLAQRDLAAQQDLEEQEFSMLDRNERQKTIFRLQQEQARLEKILEINEKATEKMTKTEVAAIKKTIDSIKKEVATTGYNNIYEVLGVKIDPDQQRALGTALDAVQDSIGSIVDSWNQAAEAAVAAADAQVQAAQRVLDAEIEARNNGYANEVTTAQKEMELAKKRREDAAKEQQKAQRAQLAADSITQASSLITASANIWASLSKIPAVGPGLAVAAIATMWASFAAAKAKAVQVTQQSEEYGEGTVELLQGGSHASGHDIDLGRKPDGTRRRAEGGEYFAVINKRNSRRYGKLIPDVINAFNDGTFGDKYQRANAAMSGYAVQMIGGKTDVSGLERDVAAIRKQGDETRYVDGHGATIITYKNLTRKIKS